MNRLFTTVSSSWRRVLSVVDSYIYQPVFKMSQGSPSQQWKPNEGLISVLTNMGISRNAAEKGLFYTGNSSAELAAAWVFDNPAAADNPLTSEEIQAQSFTRESDDSGSDDSETDDYEPRKMVYVVNMELGMGIGKVAAQVAHATLGLHRLLISDPKHEENLALWEAMGETKITLKGENTQQLLDLQKQAEAQGLPCYLVRDAGRTQIAAGSRTVLSVFGTHSAVNKVTGKLKLL